MVPEGGVPRETFVANLANVRLFAAVCSLMVFQMRRLGELHATSSALIWFFTGVYPRMVLQVHCLGKCYSTYATFVVLFARM